MEQRVNQYMRQAEADSHPETPSQNGDSKRIEPQPQQGLGERPKSEVRPHAPDSPPTTSEEYFHEIYYVLLRRHRLWQARKFNWQFNINEEEERIKEIERHEQVFLRCLPPEKREAFYSTLAILPATR
jgi:hypothetical protein